jgi:hypothetical protein
MAALTFTTDLPEAHEYVLSPCPSVDGLDCDVCGLKRSHGVHRYQRIPVHGMSAQRERYIDSGRPCGPFPPISRVYRELSDD